MRLNKATRQDLSTKINRQITSKFEERYSQEVANLVSLINTEISAAAVAYYEDLGLSKDFFSNIKKVLRVHHTKYPSLLITDEKNPARAVPDAVRVNGNSYVLHQFLCAGNAYAMVNLKYRSLSEYKDDQGNLPSKVKDLIPLCINGYNIPVIKVSTECVEAYNRLQALAKLNTQARKDLEVVLDSAVNLSQLPPDIAALVDIPKKLPAKVIPMPEALSAYIP